MHEILTMIWNGTRIFSGLPQVWKPILSKVYRIPVWTWLHRWPTPRHFVVRGNIVHTATFVSFQSSLCPPRPNLKSAMCVAWIFFIHGKLWVVMMTDSPACGLRVEWHKFPFMCFYFHRLQNLSVLTSWVNLRYLYAAPAHTFLAHLGPFFGEKFPDHHQSSLSDPRSTIPSMVATSFHRLFDNRPNSPLIAFPVWQSGLVSGRITPVWEQIRVGYNHLLAWYYWMYHTLDSNIWSFCLCLPPKAILSERIESGLAGEVPGTCNLGENFAAHTSYFRIYSNHGKSGVIDPPGCVWSSTINCKYSLLYLPRVAVLNSNSPVPPTYDSAVLIREGQGFFWLKKDLSDKKGKEKDW